MRFSRLLPMATAIAVVFAQPYGAYAEEPAAKAAPPEKPATKPPEKPGEALFAMLPADSVTQHSIDLAGRKYDYTATAGTLALFDEKGEKSAQVFYVAYTLNGAKAGERPISFAFNGGPGAASAYLHLGALAPTAIEFPTQNPADGAGAKLVDNPDTWLPFTDLVFIDPVGTGFSQAADREKAQKQFWGVRQDAQSLAKVIGRWLNKNNRTASPKYLVGESYGGIRSIKVARELQRAEGIIPNGIVMVSPAIEFSFLFDGTNPLTDALRLPTLVGASLERAKKMTPEAVDGAYSYALGPYLSTLVNVPPTGDTAKQFYNRLAEMTGVAPDLVARQRGRLPPWLPGVRTQNGRLYSLYEMSLSVEDPYPDSLLVDQPDPTLEGYGRAYGNALTGYVAQSLGYRSDLTYQLLSEEVNRKWDMQSDNREGEGHAAPPGGIDDLREALALNPSLKVLITHGYFDAVTPWGVSRWLVEHLPVGRDRITLKNYPGGHMYYTRTASRAALKQDAEALIAPKQAK